VALRIDHRALTLTHAGVGAPQPLEHFGGRAELAQKTQAVDA